jgi:3-methyladenine DNA glycosylase AlkD
MSKEDALQEVTQVTLAAANQTLATIDTLATSPQGFVRLNLRVPAVRKLTKTPYHFLERSSLSIAQQWNYIWRNTPYYEVACQALYYYQHSSLEHHEIKIIQQWINRCDCWEHSDDLSKIYAQSIEENPSWLLPTLKQWNQSKNPWKRRQSVVGLIEYASKRQRVLAFEVLIDSIDNLLADEEYYVQKGLGWTLREIHNLYPCLTLDYINARLTSIHPIAYSAATEKLAPQIKAKLTRIRKDYRQGLKTKAEQ